MKQVHLNKRCNEKLENNKDSPKHTTISQELMNIYTVIWNNSGIFLESRKNLRDYGI